MTINGQAYDYPETGDDDWGPEATAWAQAVTNGMLQKAGGLFQLLAEVDFGTAYGIKSLYLKSRTSNVASAGQIRLARADVISWRNQANGANLDLGVSASDVLQFNGVDVITSSLADGTIWIGSSGGVATPRTLSGDITVTNTGVTAIGSNKVTNTMLAQMNTQTFKGRTTAGTGNAQDLNATQATAILNNVVGDSGSGGTKGLVPAPAAGDAAAQKFLKADGSWQTPVGAGNVVGPASATDNALVVYDGITGELIKNSVIIYSSGSLTGIVDLSTSGNVTVGGNLTLTGHVVGNFEVAGAIKVRDGTSANLSICKTTDPATGFFWDGAGTLQYIAGAPGNNLFGADGNGMYIYRQKHLRMYDTATGAIAIRAPTTITSDYNWYWPTAQGAANTALLNDGAGQMSFAKIANANIDSAAAIDFSKLASLTSANILIGSAGNVATAVAVTGDISITNAGVTAYSGTVPLNKGGTGTAAASANAAFNALSPMTTGGDLIYGGASGAATRLANGSAGQFLQSAGGTSAPAWASLPTSSSDVLNLGISATVGSSALTIALKQADGSTNPSTGNSAVQIGFRSSTAGTGGYNIRSVTGALSVVVSSGSTLGSTSGMPNWVYVYAIDNAGTVELAVCGTRLADDGTLYITTAEGGAGAADSKYVLYSTTARSNVPVRLIGRVKSTQATAGTWATSPAEVSLLPFNPNIAVNQVIVDTGNGHGSTNTMIRRFSNIRENIGTAITYADSSTNGGSFTINEDGVYSMSYGDFRTATNSIWGISVNGSALTTGISSLTYAQGYRGMTTQGSAGNTWTFSTCLYLYAGDIVRAHDLGLNDSTDNHCMFTIVKCTN